MNRCSALTLTVAFVAVNLATGCVERDVVPSDAERALMEPAASPQTDALAPGTQAGAAAFLPADDLPSDAAVLAVLEAEDRAGVEEAKLVALRTKNPAVNSLSELIDAHARDDLDVIAKLGRDLAVLPRETPVSHAVTSTSLKSIAVLKTETDELFDRDYSDAQVFRLQRMVALIDDTLLPGASATLKVSLHELRRTRAHDLTEALAVRQRLLAPIARSAL